MGLYLGAPIRVETEEQLENEIVFHVYSFNQRFNWKDRDGVKACIVINTDNADQTCEIATLYDSKSIGWYYMDDLNEEVANNRITPIE